MAGASISQPIAPPNLAGIFYNSGATIPAKYRAKNALFVLGRNPTNAGRIEAAAAGAIAAIYLNVTTYSNVGTYHNMFFNAGTVNGNVYGAVGTFPRGGNGYGPPVDFTNASAPAKYEDVLRTIKAQNPWCNCIFMDDQGPDYSGYNTTSFYSATYNGQAQLTTADKANAKAYQIALAQRARKVADELGLMLIGNAEWRADTGNGYPTSNQHGCALYDTMTVEHHAASETFWTQGVMQGQWRLRDPNGQRCNFVIALPGAGTSWKSVPGTAWLTEQAGNSGYDQPTVDLGLSAHDLGFSVSGVTPSITVTVSPTTSTIQTGNTLSLTGSASNSATITWKVNGVTGGNSTVGTVSPTTGTSTTYTAPVAVPTGTTVTVTGSIATGQSGSCAVTITAAAPPPTVSVLPAPPSPTIKAFGNRFSGTIPNNMTADFQRGCFITAPEDGTVNKLVVGVDGLGSAGSGTQVFKLLLYSTTAAGEPNSLLATSAEVTVNYNDNPAWVAASFSSPPSVTANTTYFAAIHSGATSQVARFYRNDTANASRGVSDTYVGGAIDPYTGGAVGSAEISIYADYTPAGTVASHMAMNIDTNTVFGFAGTTTSAIPVTSVMYVLQPYTTTIPVPYEDVGGGVPGALLTWDGSRFIKAT